MIKTLSLAFLSFLLLSLKLEAAITVSQDTYKTAQQDLGSRVKVYNDSTRQYFIFSLPYLIRSIITNKEGTSCAINFQTQTEGSAAYIVFFYNNKTIFIDDLFDEIASQSKNDLSDEWIRVDAINNNKITVSIGRSQVDHPVTVIGKIENDGKFLVLSESAD